MRLTFFLFTTFFIGAISIAQDFKLINIDNKSFPVIKLTIELNENLDINNLKITESGKKTSMTLLTIRFLTCYVQVSKRISG